MLSGKRMTDMKKIFCLSVAGLLIQAVACFGETNRTLYVDASNVAPVYPYTNWLTAASNIQDAVDAAETSNTVIVADGVYDVGSRARPKGTSLSRVVVTNTISLQSVNGPEFTFIVGAPDPVTAGAGSNAVRCVYMTDGSISGFTLTNGYTHTENGEKKDQSGGGINMQEHQEGVVSNCVMVGNVADEHGGGAYKGRLVDCEIRGNEAEDSGGGAYEAGLSNCMVEENWAGYRGAGVYYGSATNSVIQFNEAGIYGGGAYGGQYYNCSILGNRANDAAGIMYGELYSCTVANNISAGWAGGAFDSYAQNSIVWGNQAAEYPNRYNGQYHYSCTTPLAPGYGNIDLDPQLIDGTHIAFTSPCIGMASTNAVIGTNAVIIGVDIDGEAWASSPSMGCDEVHGGSLTGTLSVAIHASATQAVEGTTIRFTSEIEGRAASNHWNFAGISATNQSFVSHTWPTAGTYDVELRAFNTDWPLGIAATVSVSIVGSGSISPHYVDAASSTPVWPYTSWATAASNIQDAVDAAEASGLVGAQVLVADGVYDTGAREIPRFASFNRVVITETVHVRSVNGPATTWIVGSEADGGGNGPGAVRCAYMRGGSLSGFTLTDGHTLLEGANSLYEKSGGAVNAYGSTGVVISNCTVTGNSADFYGGAILNGTVLDSTISSNSCQFIGGGLFSCASAVNCTIANNEAGYVGGTYHTDLTDCLVVSNSAIGSGGGVRDGVIRNTTIAFNHSGDKGGGAYGGTFYNCSISDNTAVIGGGVARGLGANLFGCVVADNHAVEKGGGVDGGNVNHCSVVRNTTDGSGGGVNNSTVKSSIVWANLAALDGDNIKDGTVSYSCSTPLPAGTGNIDTDPQLISTARITAASPCIGMAENVGLSYTDIDGEAWQSPGSIGCDEVYAGVLTGNLSVAVSALETQVLEGSPLSFESTVEGKAASVRWSFGDGSETWNSMLAQHAWSSAGTYDVELRAYNDDWPLGVASTVTVTVLELDTAGTFYVDASSATPVWPYMSWATAATNIQDAVNAAATGMPWARVLVTNGVYDTGAYPTPGHSSANRVVLTNALNVVSVNGPEHTLIVGAPDDSGGNGPNAVRCVYMTDGLLSGFTLTNGYTLGSPGVPDYDWVGGGVNMYPGFAGSISNCVITECTAFESGGGLAYGRAYDCLIVSNSVREFGGGSFNSELHDCIITGNTALDGGGGASGCEIFASLITGNAAPDGGGLYGGEVVDCVISNNLAISGGGAHSAQLFGCTIVTNTATDGGGVHGGFASNCVFTLNHANDDGGGAYYSSTLYDCIISHNTAADDGGGASRDITMVDCTLATNSAGGNGGGLYWGDLFGCTLIGNTAADYGGGVRSAVVDACIFTGNTAGYGGGMASGDVTNSLFYGNHASVQGGGVWRADLFNCTVVDNSADVEHGGISMYNWGAIDNSIIYGNSAPVYSDIYATGTVHHSCMPVVVAGTGNITNAPSFKGAGNYRLSVLSPCINAGDNAAITGGVDLDGNARTYDVTVDMGCYETFDDGSDSDSDDLTDYAEGVTLGSNPDEADTDGDGTDDGDELFVGTDLMDAASFFGITMDGDALSWPHKNGLQYQVQGCTNLMHGWFLIDSNTSSNYVDAVEYDQIFYRIQVSQP